VCASAGDAITTFVCSTPFTPPLSYPYDNQVALNCNISVFRVLTRQAESIAVYENNKKNVQEKGKVLFQLQKICRDLQIIDEVSDNKEAVISKVISRLTERLEEIPESLLLDPPKILARLQSDGRNVHELFNVKEIGTVSRVVELLYEVKRLLAYLPSKPDHSRKAE
jgi:hypothetical protein